MRKYLNRITCVSCFLSNTERTMKVEEKDTLSMKIKNEPDNNINNRTIQEQTSSSPKYTTLDSPDCGDAIDIDKTISSDSQTIPISSSIPTTFVSQNNTTDSITDGKVSILQSSIMGPSSNTPSTSMPPPPPLDTTSGIMHQQHHHHHQQQQQTTLNIRSSSSSTPSLNIQQQIANERFQQQQQQQQMFAGASTGPTKQQHIVRPLMQQQQQRVPISHNPITNILPKSNLMYHAIPYYALPSTHPHKFAMPTAASHHVAAAIKFASYQQASFHHQAKLNNSGMAGHPAPPPPHQPVEFSPFGTHPSMITNPHHLSSYQEDVTKHCTKERMRRYVYNSYLYVVSHEKLSLRLFFQWRYNILSQRFLFIFIYL